ncbi:histidine phosphatase family protein [Virgibacillus profundi]|uniref:Histidine phosphatase family protein n=1 Tax=Virgibacillus profundi TaxID=2024555 RepID=A0A2A2I9J3_9BACI|nr:histidine phosphatase family protein [Virgibacillus profundi]PAV27986.1 histidine phosphatase family protein [Virgibacillus profundi]PXY52164.1 histidine phosphatase family protein [Virgibacillus profundi]
MDDIVAITLFRHGMTEGNKRRAYMGWNDSPLCNEAVQTLTGYTFNPYSYDLFVSSDLQRCLTTIEILFSGVAPAVITELREMNFGTFQGKTYEELKAVNEYQQWINNLFTYTPPHGESFEQFTGRVQKGWDRLIDLIIQQGSKRAFIVTHGGVIRSLLHEFSPIEREFWEWSIPHGTGFVLTFDREGLRRGEHCILLQEVPLTENRHG